MREAFINFCREDLAIVFSLPSQFVLASKLYRLVQSQSRKCRFDHNLMDELRKDYPWSSSQSCGSSAAESTPISSHLSKSCGGNVARSTSSSAPSQLSRKRSHGVSSKCSKTMSDFTLPFFSLIVQQFIQRDAFYTTSQRNKLIKEACSALRGFCYGKGESVTNERKWDLTKVLLELAPKSLRDADKGHHPPLRIL